MVTVRLVVNPSTDVRFVRRAEELAAQAQSPAQLERLLRGEYVKVHVVPGVTDIFERWYVYREGHWINSH